MDITNAFVFLISGYLTKYGTQLTDRFLLLKYVKKRSISYLLPWIVWTFFIQGFIFEQYQFFDLRYLFWNMDNGYWFLITIYIISLIYGFGNYVSNHTKNISVLFKQFKLVIVFFISVLLLLLIALIIGPSFLSIKLIIYYIPFYFTGYLYGQYDFKILQNKYGVKCQDCIIAISFVFWFYFIFHFQLFYLPDSVTFILIRYIVSLTGCIAICGLSINILKSKYIFLSKIGRYTLEMYLIHTSVLNLIKSIQSEDFYSINDPRGTLIVSVIYVLTVILTIFITKFLSSNRTLRFVLFGK